MEDILWEEAINTRRSTRSFEARPVDVNTLSSLKDLVTGMRAPFSHSVAVRFFKADPSKKLYSSLGTTPIDNMAFVTSTDLPSISSAGFVGEMAILHATRLGLATCWFGHYTLAELERLMPHLGEGGSPCPMPIYGYGKGAPPGQRAICTTPLGYWRKEGLRLVDRMTESLMSYRRKPVSAFLANGINEASLPPEILYAFDLARKAPSAANSQHWRFTVSPDFQTISIAMPVGYKHIKWEHPDVDIGICACHFWLGLTMKGLPCGVSVTEQEGRAVWRFVL